MLYHIFEPQHLSGASGAFQRVGTLHRPVLPHMLWSPRPRLHAGPGASRACLLAPHLLAAATSSRAGADAGRGWVVRCAPCRLTAFEPHYLPFCVPRSAALQGSLASHPPRCCCCRSRCLQGPVATASWRTSCRTSWRTARCWTRCARLLPALAASCVTGSWWAAYFLSHRCSQCLASAA